jgi:hypothetical protein
MKQLFVNSRPYNHHDPNTKMMLEVTDKTANEPTQVFRHLTAGATSITDCESNRDFLRYIGELHGVEIIYEDEV